MYSICIPPATHHTILVPSTIGTILVSLTFSINLINPCCLLWWKLVCDWKYFCFGTFENFVLFIIRYVSVHAIGCYLCGMSLAGKMSSVVYVYMEIMQLWIYLCHCSCPIPNTIEDIYASKRRHFDVLCNLKPIHEEINWNNKWEIP